MDSFRRPVALAALIGLSFLGTTAADPPAGYVETDLVVNQQINNVPTLMDSNGVLHIAKFFDPNLVNPWGVAESATSPFWVSDNGAGKATLYNTQGAPQTLVVSIPAPGDPLGSSGTPTGAVFNTASGQQAFPISGVTSTGSPITAPAAFLFATEDGTIAGWNPNVNPPGFDPTKAGTYAIIAVDNSANPSAAAGAVYKGIAIATNAGAPFLYVTNFRAGTVEVYDNTFTRATLSADAFTDPHPPTDYSPFGIVPLTINGTTELFVTYAVPDAARHDDVAGQSHGFVDTFDTSGQLLQRFAQHDQLNSPWGVALAPASFGPFGGAVWIGNFGDGRINAFDPLTGRFLGKVRDPSGKAIVIDGLWTIRFGNGGNGGDPNTLYFTAGPNDEQDGLFGSLSPE